MLNGVSPILIFNFYTRVGEQAAERTIGIPIPISDKATGRVVSSIVPFYLDERLTGLVVTAQSKVIDISTENEAAVGIGVSASSGEVEAFQKPQSSRITIQLAAERDSLILMALNAFFEFAYKQATSQDYSITYLNNGMILFDGTIQEFVIDQNENDDLNRIRLTLEKGTGQTKAPSPLDSLSKATDTINLDGAVGNIPNVPGGL